MKNLLYIGNKLSVHGNTVTSIEVLGKFLETDGYQVAYASSEKSKIRRFSEMLRKTFALRTRADYVLIDTYSTQNFWYAFAVSQLCRLLKVKYIPILHGGNLPVRLNRNPVLCKMIFKNAHVNVAPSGYLQEAFEDAGFKVSRIPNPFQAVAFPLFERKNIGPKLLWVRAFSPIYNPEMAVKVVENLKTDFPDVTLCMVGPDKSGMLENIKELARKKNLDIIFTGRLPKEEWASLSTQYDIFINTAHTDNAPFSIIEAAALGMAIVSTDVGGIPHLLEHRKTAMLVGDNDHTAMADAVREVVQNNELQRNLIANSRHLAAESDWQSVCQKWSEILV
jgi:glycosyltransferase involved in cell wall biosynthesis